MISLKPVFYSKVGNHTNSQSITYKYYFGSIDPHFYFAVYMVPSKDTYDMFFIPQINNIANNGVVEIGENRANAKYGISYGEEVSLLLTNQFLDGFGRMVEIQLSIPEKPVAINEEAIDFADLESARVEARAEVAPIIQIGLHTLANIIMIEVEAKLNNIMESSVGVNQDNVIPTIIKGVLAIKATFVDALPSEMTEPQKEKMHMLYNRALNVAPHSNRVTVVYSDAILFARMIASEGIDMSTIPYEILFRLMSDWMKTKHSEHVALLKKASLNIEHSEDISINMSTMEDVSKVYELLNKTQSFVYLRNIKFTNTDTGASIDFPMDNEYYKNYIKSTDQCIESKGIPSSNGTVLLQYGYGVGCDEFIGLFATDNNGYKYGLRRDDKLVGDTYLVARTWQWEMDKVVKTENEIDSSGNITIQFTGV